MYPFIILIPYQGGMAPYECSCRNLTVVLDPVLRAAIFSFILLRAPLLRRLWLGRLDLTWLAVYFLAHLSTPFMYFDVIKSTQEYIGGYSSQNKSNTSDLCEKKVYVAIWH